MRRIIYPIVFLSLGPHKGGRGFVAISVASLGIAVQNYKKMLVNQKFIKFIL